MTWTMVLPILGDVIKTIIGVIAGATLAFHLNRKAQERLKKETEQGAAIVASLTVARLWSDYTNFADNLEKHKLKVIRVHPNLPAWDTLPQHMRLPTMPKVFENLKFDFGSLPFLFQAGYESLLGELHMLQSRYANFAMYVGEFNEAHVEAHRRIVEKLGLDNDVPLNELSKILGADLYRRLEFFADAVLKSVSYDMAHIRRVAPLLEGALAKHFGPGVKFMKLRLDLVPATTSSTGASAAGDRLAEERGGV